MKALIKARLIAPGQPELPVTYFCISASLSFFFFNHVNEAFRVTAKDFQSSLSRPQETNSKISYTVLKGPKSLKNKKKQQLNPYHH